MALPTLVYFPVRGRAEVIRLVLAEANIDYQERHVGRGTPPVDGRLTDFAALKASGELPFGALPVWEEEGGFRLAQSGAIATYLARRGGLLGKSEHQAALCHQMLDAVEDVRVEIRKLPAAALEQRAAVREKLIAEVLPRWFGFFQRLLEANAAPGGFLVGDEVSLADLALWYALELIRDNKLGAGLADYPVLGGFFERIQRRPRITDYLVSSRRPELTLLVG